MAYPDSLVVTRPGAGATDANDVFAPGAATTVYDDGCDFQDHPTELTRERGGDPSYPRKAVAFLEDETKAKDVRLNDQAAVTLGSDGTVAKGRIIGIRKLDGRVEIGDLTWPT
jgi:hypothetical protein